MVNTDIINAYVGSSQVDKIMLGSEQVYPTAEPVYSEMYLTVEALENGNFYVRNENFEFSKNGGAWTSGVGNQTIPLVTGDKVGFRHNTNSSFQGMFSGNTMSFKVYGNIESMEYGDNFSGQTTVKLQNAFRKYFLDSSGLTDASNLILPATALTQSCYSQMFEYCVNLTTAPVLIADSRLPGSCYASMFLGCSNLNSIRCLALSKSLTSVSNWVNGVAASGTFIKAAGAEWVTGKDGIPRGWTVIEEGDKLTFESSDGVTGDGRQYSPGMWDMTETISNIASYTLYYGGEVVTADTHVTIINVYDSTIDYDTEETGMVWSGVDYGYGYGESGTIDVNINYSAQTGTANLVVGYWHDNTPPDICEDWEGAGYSSYEDCRCQQYGEGCEDLCQGDPECECVNQGGTWNGTDCEFQMDDPGTEPDE